MGANGSARSWGRKRWCRVGPWVLCAVFFLHPQALQAWQAGGAAPSDCRPDDMVEARERMVRRQIEARGVRHPGILEAMRTVPRHCFVPASLRDEAYRDHPLPIGLRQTISQPYIVGLMTELLAPEPSHRVLEIGTGSGYHAAVLSRVAHQVYTVEILPALARQAEDRLRSLGFANVQVRVGDGNLGWPEHAPFDAILVTAAAEEIPEALMRQLKSGGRMVLPVGALHDVQRLTVVEKAADGSISIREVLPVRFVPLTKGASKTP